MGLNIVNKQQALELAQVVKIKAKTKLIWSGITVNDVEGMGS